MEDAWDQIHAAAFGSVGSSLCRGLPLEGGWANAAQECPQRLVEAAGVELAVNTENTQVTETKNSGNVPNSTIDELAYKSRTKISGNSQNFSRCIFRSEPADDLKSFFLSYT